MNPHLQIETIIQAIEDLKHENRYGEARLTALEALTKHTDDYRLYEELADIYLFEENIEKAEEVIAYARTLHPESATGIYLEGFISTLKGDFDHAIEILTKANALIPNNAEIIRNLGWSYVMKGQTSR
jgi:Flp pilus assembly protein TadD